jgi:hypothetical protein
MEFDKLENRTFPEVEVHFEGLWALLCLLLRCSESEKDEGYMKI